jgi:hypothetical protein
MLALALGACSSTGVPTLAPTPAPVETGNLPTADSALETTTIAEGTPTEVYALVARGALGCWFGSGPLRGTHIFQAEASPPAQGGMAEIVVHERDPAMRDHKGAKAFRVTFAGAAQGVRVGIVRLKVETRLGDLMVKDVTVWAGGGKGCEARAIMPPAPAQPEPKKTAPANRKR